MQKTLIMYHVHFTLFFIFFFFSSRRRHTRSSTVSWARNVYKRQSLYLVRLNFNKNTNFERGLKLTLFLYLYTLGYKQVGKIQKAIPFKNVIRMGLNAQQMVQSIKREIFSKKIHFEITTPFSS